MSADEIEMAEREALLADIERQVADQRRVIEYLRGTGQPTHRAGLALHELQQKADRQRDYLRVIRERIVVTLS
jgi:uncharacterized coiled-coil protein SlyX